MSIDNPNLASAESSLLGQEVSYPEQYAPDILFAIPRAPARADYAHIVGIQQGIDWWHVFELSWLDDTAKPHVAIARLHIPANSANLIESKSLKLYFNSLNFKLFSDQTQLIECIEHDLSAVAQSPVKVQLFQADALLVEQPQGILLDDLQPSVIATQPTASILRLDQHKPEQTIDATLYSHLLRSNCPVTGQPDWGTIFIRYQGLKPCYSALLAYIISYRRHSGFHEQCVEQIFADIWRQLKPTRLMVYAAYTRRGGLDINPCRVSDPDWIPAPIRLSRQ